MQTIAPGTQCPICGKKHRSGSKALAKCQAAYEAQTPARQVIADRTARWNVTTETDDRGVKIGREWHAADSRYHVTKISTSFAVSTTDTNGLADTMTYGTLSEAIDVIEDMEAIERASKDAPQPVTETPGADNDTQLREAVQRAHKGLTAALEAIPDVTADGYAFAVGMLEARIKSALIDLEVYGGAGK